MNLQPWQIIRRCSVATAAGLLSLGWTAVGQQWNSLTPLPDGYAEQSLVYWNGFLYQTGGASYTNGEADGTNVFFAQVYTNGTIGAWSRATPLPEAVFEHGGVAANGFVYVLGGLHYTSANGDFYSSTVYYSKINSDESLGQWQTANPLPQTLYYLNASVWNNTIYVVGGATASALVNSVYSAKIQNDGSLSSWVTNTPLPYATDAQAGAVNGMLYMFGGVVNEGTQITNEAVYSQIKPDGSLAAWNTATLPRALSDCGAVAANGRVFVMGGWNGSDLCNNFYSALVGGDGSLGNWVAGPNLPQSCEDFGVTVAGPYIFISGGVGESAVLNSVYSLALPPPPALPALVSRSFTNGNFQLQLASITNTGFGFWPRRIC